MPDFVEKNVISEVKDGKKVFKEWGGQVNLGTLLWPSCGNRCRADGQIRGLF